MEKTMLNEHIRSHTKLTLCTHHVIHFTQPHIGFLAAHVGQSISLDVPPSEELSVSVNGCNLDYIWIASVARPCPLARFLPGHLSPSLSIAPLMNTGHTTWIVYSTCTSIVLHD